MTLPTLQVQNYGEVFTRDWVAEALLSLTGYTDDKDLGALRLVEPSCGSGAFLGVAVKRLISSAKVHGRALASLGGAIRAYDLQADQVKIARTLCSDLLREAGADLDTSKALADEWVTNADFLLIYLRDFKADVVIGNPPYVRYDDLTELQASMYRRKWPTMRGRGDIYVGFFERALRMLTPGGKVGFICADRWMRNQYGADLRKLVTSEYSVDHVWTLHDVYAFELEVSAYPAITVLSNRPQGPVSVAEMTFEYRGTHAWEELVNAVLDENFTEFVRHDVTAHRLPQWFQGDGMWPIGSPARLALIKHLNDNFHHLHDENTGTKVAIGIATGADKVYITQDATCVEQDRLLPLAMRSDLASGKFQWQGNYLVNPWNEDGTLVALDDYPRLRQYLSAHAVLRDRFVAKKSPDSWYRTIDKVQAALTDKKKLLLQDMKSTIQPVLEEGGHYPHHNLYYVTSDTWDMEVLGGILLSRIAQAFIEAYAVRMRGDTLRFQAQYLKLIRVPAQDEIDANTQEALREAFRARDVQAATNAAAIAYKIDLKDYELMPATEEKSRELSSIQKDFNTAIIAFWEGRTLQTQKQLAGETTDVGTRAAVTAGKHLDAVGELIAQQFAPLALLTPEVKVHGQATLPGYYRRSKNWDIVVTYRDILVAAIECKSQVGSVGNNFNNRAEEAIGSATDLRRAFAHLKPNTRVAPWLGYMFVFERTKATLRPVRDKAAALFGADPDFADSSYAARYQLLCQRLVQDGVYDAACFVSTSKDKGISDEPVPELSTESFIKAIADRVSLIEKIIEEDRRKK
ncbi:PaeR7I family type II restriction endonuclease [Nocardia sp. NRRL S-836]|uniref:PaeR7I family type II restriction endonuclease n=1 Tax=Nocardia sp. NRRL S-836 TaxID=1519492 RepID=UPI0018D06712|nr:PaeR7I family type II restriction endonuclease [Nocardia sp. NRRL S-836]